MRIIWYMMDGLSAEKLNTLNFKSEYNNYFDFLLQESLTFSKVYGSGETFASLASKMTGDTLDQLKSDDWHHEKSFNSKNNIAYFLKEKFNTNNIFYRNYSLKYPLTGVYARFNDLCTFGFDKYILRDDSRIDLEDSSELKKHYDFFNLEKSKLESTNTFIFIHDLHLHDHPSAYESTSITNYEDAIQESAQHLQRNLDYLKFNDKEDILIISSDHGLTIRPELDLFTNKATTEKQYDKYKSCLYSELKLRSFFAIKSNNLEKKIIDIPLTMPDVNFILLSFFSSLYEEKTFLINDLISNYKNKLCITSVADLAYGNTSSLKKRQKFHAHIIGYLHHTKWVYTRWPKKQFFMINLQDNKTISNISMKEFPREFQEYISNYYSLKSFLKKYYMSYFYNQTNLFKKMKQMLKKIFKSILPKKFINILLNINNNYLDGFAVKSYSQEGEDMILRRLFENKQNGFYVDVGAHHPKRFSNTYFFYLQGWNGINIDAMPGSMKAFNKFRPKDINIEKPVSDKKQILTYYAFNEPALNGFSKELSEQRDGLGNYFIKFTKDIETATLEEILDSNLPSNKKIDFLSIDVEGLDFMVLKSNNFAKYQPKVILIEILESSLSEIEDNEIVKYLTRHGYSIYAKAVNTVFFTHHDFLGHQE